MNHTHSQPTTSDTPRTDKELERMKAGGCPGIVCGDFARTLERELNEANKAADQLVEIQTETAEQLLTATQQLDEAMKYARHKAECAVWHGADWNCTCGLTELKERVK